MSRRQDLHTPLAHCQLWRFGRSGSQGQHVRHESARHITSQLFPQLGSKQCQRSNPAGFEFIGQRTGGGVVLHASAIMLLSALDRLVVAGR